MARIMVTGATGLLGRALVKHLTEQGEHQLIACGFSRMNDAGYRLDLTQASTHDIAHAIAKKINLQLTSNKDFVGCNHLSAQ